MKVITIQPDTANAADSRGLQLELERGNILVIPRSPFMPSDEDCEFLRCQRQVATSAHKNIAYKPEHNRTTGIAKGAPADTERLTRILSAYSRGAIQYMESLLPEYGKAWQVDYASFRPEEEQGRKLPIRHRNDLMHVDAFPTRPTHGARILRAFTNLHPERPRVWITADDFEELARLYSRGIIPGKAFDILRPLRAALARPLRTFGLRIPDRTAYDETMIRMHHHLKQHVEFQANGRRDRSEFPAGSTWISFTDQIAHAVERGQYALEQTCIVPLSAMVAPELAPISVLERLAGRKLAPRPGVDFAGTKRKALLPEQR